MVVETAVPHPEERPYFVEVIKMFGYCRDEKTDNERYLEQELEDERRRREEDRQERERERNRAREEMREMYEISLRSANGWHEALGNQAALMGREIDYETWADEYYDGQYFSEGMRACWRAIEILEIEEAKVASEIAELEQRIEELHEAARIRTGERLRQEKQWQSSGWIGVATTLEDPNEDPESWLNW
ncbi:MAG: hypothetical protein KDE47_04775 [Caldilineaceae bacterium]|nr:hypothetical protein [Caldilineaceae bacterium]